jgi:1-acyl-sn-glycerol-3-phosphate acyltransferase
MEHVPESGPGIVVACHRSWLDPACVGAACPRPVRFLIREDVYRKRWGRWFYSRMGGLPVAPGGGRAVSALRSALRALGRGELVGVFPEGRVVRPGEVSTVHPGAALLAVHTGAPIVPVLIEGSERAWPHGRCWPGPARVRVRIGPPFVPPADRARTAVEELVRRMGRALDELAGSAP